MGQLDQFIKQMFAEETERATGGAAHWQEPVELNLTEVRLDGMLLVRDAARLIHLSAPWSEAGGLDEIVLELKMQGDHLAMPAVQRGLLRRQARQVQRAEDAKAPWEGEQALWFVPSPFPFLWIAANELPLSDELIPFLIARSGRSLDEFCLWASTRKPPEWVARMVEFLPMSVAAYDEMVRWISTKTDDPVMNERKRRAVRIFMETTPEVRDELVDEGRLAEAREGLRRVLARRKLVPSPEDEARIAACADVVTLHRWHDQAIDAPSAAEALR